MQAATMKPTISPRIVSLHFFYFGIVKGDNRVAVTQFGGLEGDSGVIFDDCVPVQIFTKHII